MSDTVLMRCAAIDIPYRHPLGRHEIRVPFVEALHSPPICHDTPRLTVGGLRTRRIAERIRERGLPSPECRVDFGLEQAAWCHEHGWGGSAGDVKDGDCPHAFITRWILRRHEAAQ